MNTLAKLQNLHFTHFFSLSVARKQTFLIDREHRTIDPFLVARPAPIIEFYPLVGMLELIAEAVYDFVGPHQGFLYFYHQGLLVLFEVT